MIPYGKHSISQADIDAVVAVLKSDFITQGETVPEFERQIARYTQARYAVAVNSATSALHLACRVLGLGPGDYLWTTPNTFVASANCALYCGAQVDFVDIDAQTYNMSVTALQAKLQWARQQGCLPKVVVPVHFAGQSCDMQAIKVLADRYGFKIIEDAAHAIGGEYKGRPIGCGQFSDLTVFSLHPVKIITTGEGGLIATNHEVYYEHLQRLRSHGITRNPQLISHESEGDWYYQQIDLGYNYRLTDIQAALGLSQLTRLDAWVEARRQHARYYTERLTDVPVRCPYQSPDTRSAWHLYVVQLDDRYSRKTIFDALRRRGIGVHVHYIPVHTQPYYQHLGFKAGDFPVAEQYYAKALSLPLFADITQAQQDYIIAALHELLL